MEQEEISQEVYRPHSRSKCYPLLRLMYIATVKEPDYICGVASRIGYTGKDTQALPMYRLKITQEGRADRLTLPPFFVLEKGVFVEYERWSCTAKTT